MAFRIVCAPVEERDRLILEHHEKNIVRLMDPDQVSRLLQDKGIIDNNDRKQILQPKIPVERNRLLLGMLLTRGPEAYKNYVNVLTESGSQQHAELARILCNDDPSPRPLPVEGKLQDVRHKRISEKIDDHEERLQRLEDDGGGGVTASSSDVDSLQEELSQRAAELEELRLSLQTRDGELVEAREENRALQKRIAGLEKKIVTLETHLEKQRARTDTLSRQQQQDKKSIKQLEDRNARLESRMETTEKKLEKKLGEQGRRHQKELDDIRQMIRDSNAKPSAADTAAKSSSTSSKTALATGSTKHASSSGNLPKAAGVTAKNRFQAAEDRATAVKMSVATAGRAKTVQAWRKSTADPQRLPDLASAGQKKK